MNTSTTHPTSTDSTISHLFTALRVTVVSVLALGFLYPFALTGVAQVAFPHPATGLLILDKGKLIGAEDLGQRFTQARYFQGRPSAAGNNGYDPTSTGGTNLGPTSKKLMDSISATAKSLRSTNPGEEAVPVDLVTSSASGLDPDIAPEDAQFQVQRIARARGLRNSEVSALVMRYTKPRLLGILGEPHINVLAINRALDAHERNP